MKKGLKRTLLTLTLVNTMWLSTALTANAQTVNPSTVKEESVKAAPEFALDRVIVGVDRGVAPSVLFAGVKVKNYRMLTNNPIAYLLTLEEPGEQQVLDAVKVLEKNKGVRYAEPDYYVYLVW